MTYIVHLVLTLFFLILTLDLSFAQGDLSATLQGQAVATKLTVGTIQVPNNLATKTGSINALIETGNTNILSNPGFEHQTPTTNWTLGGTASYSSSTSAISGLKALKVDASSQTIDVSQTTIFYASQFADGVQGLASIRVKTNHTGTCSVCSVQNSTVSTTNCVTVQANNKWGLYKVPFILGATNNGISLACTSGTGTTLVDDAFVGAVDLQASVDQSRVAGEAYFAGTTGCSWSRTSTTVGAFGATAACPGPTIVTSTMGQWQTTDSDLPRVTINNLPAGTYKAKFLLASNVNAVGIAHLAIFDGSSTCYAVFGNYGTSFAQSIVECSFTYSSAGNRSFELYGASSNTLAVNNATTTPPVGTKFILEYFGSGSVYTSTNADTDWASCGHTTSDFTGFGTVTNIETQCKREGSDLLMRGKFTTGTPTAGAEVRMNLPLWNGVRLSSASTSLIPSIQSIGLVIRSASATTYFHSSALIEPSTSYITFGSQSSTLNANSKALGAQFGSSEVVTFQTLRIPISGWTNSNIIIGQFNGLQQCTDTLACTDTFSAKVSSTGVVSDENVNWINGNCSTSGTASSTYTCPYNSGLNGSGQSLTSTLNCSVEGVSLAQTVVSNSSSSSQLVYSTSDSGGTASQSAVHIICQKQGADYVGKTALAVASDQNLRTPGVTKGVRVSATINTSGVPTETGGFDWINGNCVKSGTNNFITTCTLTANALNAIYGCNINVFPASGINYTANPATVNTSTIVYYTGLGSTASNESVYISCDGATP